ncbi:MAG TPA: enoyl-CoA hydratase [Acidimicrobiales bacterium]|nr:enoyl-CoA hydratase [Acidimicrobiales bacterium]
MIHLEDRGAVALITIDRQDRRNALDHEALDQLLDAHERSAAARVVVVTGAGGHFCAGADLSGVEDPAFTDRLREVLGALRDDPRPLVAAIDGAALGLGTQLAVACDLRVATPAARFGIPAAKLGLLVDHWTIQRLSLLAGAGPARAMLVAAETYGGEDALGWGFVQRLGDLDAALGWADEIAALAPLTVAGHKLALNRLEMPVGRGEDPEVHAAWDAAWGSEDLQEGIAAFRDRRRPHFTGR